MSDFFEQPDNQKLLRKIELKQNNEIDIKQDTIQLIAAAFESMTDEDWIEFEQKSDKADHLFKQYYPNLSPIPAATIRQLVENIPTVIHDIEEKFTDRTDESFIYVLMMQTIACEIANRNDLLQLYSENMPGYQQAMEQGLSQPADFQEWKHNMLQYCHSFLTARDDAGYWLFILYMHISYTGMFI